MGQLDTTSIFARKFTVIEYGAENQHMTWQYIKSQMRGLNPAAVMEAVFRL